MSNMDNYNNNDNNNKKDDDNNRILLVDDEVDITMVYTMGLQDNGFKVDAFNDPLQALSNFKSGIYSLVLIDYKMPKMNGMTLYHKIKEIDNSVIICFTTADINSIEDLRKGIIDIEKIVLYKPVLLKDLKNKIDWLLSRHEEIRNSNKPTTRMIL